jgi:Uma2 family endonuclease
MSSSTSTLAAPATSLPELRRAHADYETLPLEQRDDITVDELERLALPATAELYEGRLVFKMANPLHAALAARLATELNNYMDTNLIGMVFTEAHYRLWPERNNRVRVPDVSFVLTERLPEDLLHYPAMAPDLAVEILSPTDNFLEVMDKVDEYLQQGAKIVWLVIPQKEEVLVCTVEGKHSVRELLTAPELLPGLEIPLKKVFAKAKAGAPK